MSSPKELIDAHTFSLPSQGSIYTQSTICLTDGTCKLIVASLNRKVFCCELSMTHCALPCGCAIVPQVKSTVGYFLAVRRQPYKSSCPPLRWWEGGQLLSQF